MLLYNTADKKYVQPLKNAVLQSLAPGKGLYMPCHLPLLNEDFIENIEKYSLQDIGFEVCKSLFSGYIPEDRLREIIDQSINFPADLVKLSDDIYSMELWHGPSLAFKDFGARFMAALMSYFVEGEQKPLSILVATSGDTGGAVAFGFLGLPNIEVIILYPKGKVSHLQEKQLTTLGKNIHACEVNGTFDDCQYLVKEAFDDSDLSKVYHLSSANSINIARLIPQSFYYFEAYKHLKSIRKKIVASVPSGNFGNLTAGLLAHKMGLPIDHFIAATNVNHVVPDYLSTGVFDPKPSIATISNAMDVGNPSNFVRMQEMFHHDYLSMNKLVSGRYYTDEETKDEMMHIYKQSSYISEPHGAIGHRALRSYLENHTDKIGFFLETAHPSKFEDTVNETLGINIQIPERLAILSERKKVAVPLENNYASFKDFLIKRRRL
ncbi:MAG: hypothetical protein RLZZ546_3048 [Bacteroidota bacterium]|jgi:threonine synthase